MRRRCRRSSLLWAGASGCVEEGRTPLAERQRGIMLNFLKTLLGEKPARAPDSDPPLQAALHGQRHAESGLRKSEEHFAQLVAGVRDHAVFLMDRHGKILTWNAGAEWIKGYRPEEIIGQHFTRFYTQEAISTGWPAHELEVASVTGRFEDEGWRL